MMCPVELRRATQPDWPAIWPVWHEVVAAGETYCWAPDTPEAEARALWMLPEPAEVWVAARDGAVVGTAVLKPNQPGRGSHVANASFMVAAAATGHGVGRALAERLLHRAAELGYLAMQFNAVVGTNTRAIALWRSLGFTIVGTVPAAFRHPAHGLVPLHVMHRLVGAADRGGA
ncbi:MAG TPA: GNAT family N-acetyltransferase [Mycobacteriales bacterium]|nr:GNAT family N-acetyltransferase [Mycobacteriales bacterium]